ncbi:uncharacterized protein A4U43_C01F2820 [Asparagus officinalis]|uniref:Methyltransferase-like protein 1 n=1 Tax=Asparagus officinalis TaxID=4686 RepID=A0A5P1FLI0_ASPOF|nr:methyltransferase-like protein 1 [Asparagus officinalis]ONK79088.1 uncharacterized protein A4U43_C01F2820 [Asparagus officinalis]
MEVSESSWSRSNKRDVEDGTEARESSRIEDDEGWDGSDKRKHRSSKSHKHNSSQEEVEEQDSGRRKSSGDRGGIRKKSGSSSRVGSGDEDDYDSRRESWSKIPRRSLDEKGERRASEGYRERDLDSSRRNRDEEPELNSLRKSIIKPSVGQETSQGKSQGKSGSKVESSHERDVEKGRDLETKYPDGKESGREKDYGWHEQERNPARRRVDEVGTGRRAEEINYGDRKASDHYKHGNNRERAIDPRNESAEERSRAVDSSREKSGRREDKRGNDERSRGRSDAQAEDLRTGTTLEEARDDKQRKARGRSEDLEPTAHRYSSKAHGEKTEKHRRDEIDSRGGREITHAKRSRSPERSGRYHRESDVHERGLSESDTERNIGSKGKERDKENYRDDRPPKGKDSWEGSKEHWRRSHSRKDAGDGDNYEFDHAKEWHDKDRMVADKLYGRSAYRKDNRVRTEGLKASSNSGTKHDNSDSIEIKPNLNFDFGREKSVSTLPEEEWGYSQDDSLTMDHGSGRAPLDSPAGRGRGQKGSGQSMSGGVHPPANNHGSGSFGRVHQQGQKGGRPSRGRGRPPSRDSQRAGLPLPMMPPPFSHLNLPPGPMQPGGPNLAHSPGPSIPPNVFIPSFTGPLVWPGPRGVDMSMLAVPPNLPPMPPTGPGGPRFGPNVGNGPNHPLFFNQQGPGRGAPPNLPGPLFNPVGPIGRDTANDKPPTGWGQTRSSGPSGKAPSRGEQNDYSQNFVDTGMRPQNFIRELELTSVVEDYPKLRELIQRKDEIVAKAASPPMYYKCDLKDHVLSPDFFGTKFDVILVDPPWEEYVHRAPGVTDHLEYWTFEEIQNLKIEAIADTPSFIFLWVGDGVGLEQGRQCLKKWGFRRCEDICWVKTNKKNATPGLRHDSHTLFQHSKEHCLMGIKGTVRRSTDGHIIHANIDTDIIIAEEPTDGSTKKPDDMYRIIEHFALGRRRLELFGEDHNIRSGWLTVGKGLSSSNFNAEAYIRNFSDKDGKVWQGGGGRNPPPEAPHLVLTTPEIEGLRPKSPPAKSQQQQSMSLITPGSSNSRRVSGNSPQNPSAASFPGMNQEPSGLDPPNSWVSPMASDDKFYDGYGFNPACAGQVVGDHIEFDPHRMLNMNMM